ncbi:cation-translocating P-type ATPase [Aspergillus lucknowensis]|uniref:Cation-transporting P-type ATPase N-terminal domain-containing protein n=1 Tax=Aspergillus lucknowensis TaxID=176173 RepID=A0ABR4LKD3_9EURO
MDQDNRKDHIRIAEDGTQRNETRPLSRRNSSISIHSARGRVVAPENLLPITYRTLSFKVDNTFEKNFNKDAANKQEREQIQGLAELDHHLVSVDELQRRLSTSPQGLRSEQVSRRIAECGKNQPSPPPSRWLLTVLGYVFGGFGSILLGGGVLVFIAWKPLGDPPAEANLALAIVLIAVWVIQAAFNAWQDWSSSRVMASITTMLPDQCIVTRDSNPTNLSAVDLVPGDLVQIKQGNKLPADVRFIQTSADAKFDRSILTGESKPVSGTVECTNNNFLETNNIGLQGTYCVSGAALGIVVGTGDRTVFGRIARLSNGRRTGMTPMQKEILRFVLVIISFIVTFVAIIIIIWAAYLHKDHPDFINVPTLIVSCVSVGIAFVPEGLPIAVSMGLTIVAGIMKQNKILCKSLATVETLGAVSVICSDKTGTLTKNEMFVTDCFSGGEEYPSEEVRERMVHGPNTSEGPNESIGLIRAVGGLCNAAEFDVTTLDRPLHAVKLFGDPTDQAILRLSQSLGPVSELRGQWEKHFEIPFNSKNKFMVRVMSPVDQQGGYLFIKGAPDILLSKCEYAVNRNGQTELLSQGDRNQIEAIKDRWSVKGKRVILMAQRSVSSDWLNATLDEKVVLQAAQGGLTLVGLVGLIDPPRDEIPGVIDTLRRASVRIMMVTGDYKLTAQAIAIECGIIRTPPDLIDDIKSLDHSDKTVVRSAGSTNAIVVSGPDLADLSDEEWDTLCNYDEIVFARTTPEQKLRIVKEFQARNNIVAMTGDGVNDAPSLKAADVGVALGSGSDIAIEAADIVLLDSFSAIVEAVKYGRLVYDNLKKTIIYLLPAGSFSELWPVVTNVVLGVPQVLSSFLMIIICCLTDCAGAITLAFEKPESDLLLRPPRNPKKDRLVDVKLLGHAYLFIGLYECFMSFVMAFWHMQRRGVPFSAMVLRYGSMDAQYDPDYVTQVANEASSIYFVNLVFMQFFNLLAVRTRRLSIFQQPPIFEKETQNLLLFPAMLFALCVVFIFLYIPDLHESIGTTTVPVEHFFLPIAFGIGLLVLDEIRKYWVRRWPGGILARIAW